MRDKYRIDFPSNDLVTFGDLDGQWAKPWKLEALCNTLKPPEASKPGAEEGGRLLFVYTPTQISADEMSRLYHAMSVSMENLQLVVNAEENTIGVYDSPEGIYFKSKAQVHNHFRMYDNKERVRHILDRITPPQKSPDTSEPATQ